MEKLIIRYKFIPLFIILIFLNSCIEIEEKIMINNNLSGHVEYEINTSGFGSFFSGFFDNSIQAEIKVETNKFIQKLQNQPGISNVAYNNDISSGNFYISFDFLSAKDFNNAFFAMGGVKKTVFTPGYLKLSNKRAKKLNFSNYLALYLKKENIEIPDQYLNDMVTFKASISTPKKIKKTKGINVKVSNDNRTATQTFPVKQIIHNKVNTGIKIRY